MKITIKRFHKEKTPQNIDHTLDINLENITLLDALENIKTKQDPSLTYSSGCRSGVCGSCGVRVNGKSTLACTHKLKDGDIIEPLNNMPIIKDLVVDHNIALKTLQTSKSWQDKPSSIELSIEDEKQNELQSDCILCGSCYSACPVFEVNKDFLGPFALTRIRKYTADLRDENYKDKIDRVQINGVWDCTLCNECSLSCPSGISSKSDIEMLRIQSVKQGYSDPSFANFGGLDFGAPQF